MKVYTDSAFKCPCCVRVGCSSWIVIACAALGYTSRCFKYELRESFHFSAGYLQSGRNDHHALLLGPWINSPYLVLSVPFYCVVVTIGSLVLESWGCWGASKA
jgi:hypothetical protein